MKTYSVSLDGGLDKWKSYTVITSVGFDRAAELALSRARETEPTVNWKIDSVRVQADEVIFDTSKDER